MLPCNSPYQSLATRMQQSVQQQCLCWPNLVLSVRVCCPTFWCCCSVAWWTQRMRCGTGPPTTMLSWPHVTPPSFIATSSTPHRWVIHTSRSYKELPQNYWHELLCDVSLWKVKLLTLLVGEREKKTIMMSKSIRAGMCGYRRFFREEWEKNNGAQVLADKSRDE